MCQISVQNILPWAFQRKVSINKDISNSGGAALGVHSHQVNVHVLIEKKNQSKLWIGTEKWVSQEALKESQVEVI